MTDKPVAFRGVAGHGVYDVLEEEMFVLTELKELFGIAFSLWAGSSEWEKVWSEPEARLPSAAEVEQAFVANQPVVSAISDTERLVVIPFEAAHFQRAAAVVAPARADDSWDRLAQAGHKLIARSQLLDQMETILGELSESMEQSTWMRGLFQSVQSCEASQTVAEVAQLMLPKLASIIQARSVGFLPNKVEQQPIWTDRRNVPKLDVLQAAFPEWDAEQAFVFNARAQGEVDLAGVSNLILAPVRFRGRDYGFVAAVDCKLDPLGRRFSQVQLSELEFGTEEASLVEAAAAMLATHCRNAGLLQAKERLVIGVVRSLGGAVDARDPYTKGHSDRVARYAREIAREMGIEEAECQRIYVTGLLHDIGKIGVPDEVLKKPAKLTEEEYEIIKTHPRLGFEILKGLEEFAFTLPGVLHHHERIDGKGYPAGLAGDGIPESARIIAVADAFDAMTSSRAYRDSMPFEKAEQIVRDNIGSQFDAQAAAAFLRITPLIRQIAEADSARRLPESANGAFKPSSPATDIEIDSAVAALLEV